MNTLAIVCFASLSSLCSEHLKTTTSIQPSAIIAQNITQIVWRTDAKNPAIKRVKDKISIKPKLPIGWEISVNKQPILTTSNPLDAALLVARLNSLLQRPNLDPDQILPAQIGDRYVGVIGSEILFTLPASRSKNPTLTLFNWVNNLRTALKAEPLTLLEAQEQMYGLVGTDKNLQGIASWYGPYFQGRQTASGEIFEQQDFTAAHQDLPFDTYLKVTNLKNGNSVVVRINDRGPYIPPRMLDLSYAAAIQLNSEEAGVVPIQATIMAKQ